MGSPAPSLPESSSRRSKCGLIERLRACNTEVIAKAPNVNHGGCGVYAANVAMALEEHGLTVWAVLTSRLRDDDLNVVRNESKPNLNKTLEHDSNVLGGAPIDSH